MGKRILSAIIMLCMMLTCSGNTITYATTNIDDYNTANVVVYVSFSDTLENHEGHINSNWGECFLKDPKIEQLFNGTSYPKSLHQYLYNISYGKLNVKSIFPQYDENTKTVTPYQLPNTAEYFSNRTTAPYAIYVFRPGDTYDSNGIEAGQGTISESFLSQESGRIRSNHESLFI